MKMSYLSRFLLGFVLCVFATSCMSWRKPVEPVEEPVTIAEFRPVVPLSRLHLDGGRYPNLFSSSSYAVWVSPEVVNLKLAGELESGVMPDDDLGQDALVIDENYIVIECHVDSVFSDSSIAYDVVWFRNIDVYLLLPDGRKLRPAMTFEGAEVREELCGALTKFGRTNLLVFPRMDLFLDVPTVAAATPGVRLVLEGYNTTLYYAWRGVPPSVDGDSPAWVPSAVEKAKVAQVQFSELFGRLRELAHVLD